MSLVEDIGKGIWEILLLVGIAPLPVSLLVYVISPYDPTIYYAIGAHIGFLAIVFSNSHSRLREAQIQTTSDAIGEIIRYYCASYVAIALFFGSSAALYLIAPNNAGWNEIGRIVISLAGLLICVGLFNSKKPADLTPPSTPEPIRGTHVKSGDDLPNYLPPPPGGISE